ncbi:hypothetical protein SDC9_150838 [bioreactor metagenome]|uniref:Carbohydrate-binding domain-containing protein n=1 Tax=bioreactor metagenome TaxID=1076179 RepID=A0A645EP70_9ZZZZ
MTRYRVELPLEQLKLGNPFRFALLVTDNDGGRMLRNLIWNDGIQPAKNTNLFGWGKLVK